MAEEMEDDGETPVDMPTLSEMLDELNLEDEEMPEAETEAEQ